MSGDATLKHVATRELRIAYLERGPADGTPVLLVHGFPDDAGTWDAVTTALAQDGCRTIMPYVRGFGATQFAAGAEITGEIASIARDALALVDALGIGTFHYVGHDWGARAGYALAVLAPERLQSLTTLAVAYGPPAPPFDAMSLEQTRAYWYQWYFATPRGAEHLAAGRRTFCRALWSQWSPNWRFGDDAFDATAASWDNRDFVAVALSSYRQRWGFAPGAAAYADDRAALARVPRIAVPTTTIMGRDDGATLPASADGKETLFSGDYRLELVHSGHFVQRERPQAVVAAVRARLRGGEKTG